MGTINKHRLLTIALLLDWRGATNDWNKGIRRQNTINIFSPREHTLPINIFQNPCTIFSISPHIFCTYPRWNFFMQVQKKKKNEFISSKQRTTKHFSARRDKRQYLFLLLPQVDKQPLKFVIYFMRDQITNGHSQSSPASLCNIWLLQPPPTFLRFLLPFKVRGKQNTVIFLQPSKPSREDLQPTFKIFSPPFDVDCEKIPLQLQMELIHLQYSKDLNF